MVIVDHRNTWVTREMNRGDKVIITCAITGGIHTPSMSPYLPITSAQIVAHSVAAAEAGAAIIHLHARDPKTGKPDQSPERFMEFLPQIKRQTDAILNITTGGGLGMTYDQRLAPAMSVQPEIASMNMGSFNFNISGAAEKRTEWRYDWERPYLEASRDLILSNTFTQIERDMRELGAVGTRFEFECYDVGHLHSLAHFADRGLVKPPFFVQCIFGILGGNVRVGLEDSLYAAKGKLATSNSEQVAKIRRILEEMSLEIASPAEARAMLGTKGRDHVKF